MRRFSHAPFRQMQSCRTHALRQRRIVGDQKPGQPVQFFRQHAASLCATRAHHNDSTMRQTPGRASPVGVAIIGHQDWGHASVEARLMFG